MAKRIWFRDFGYYALRWTIVVGVLTAITYTDVPANAPASYFWQSKVTQLLLGIGYGFLCALVFTLVQNSLNAKRREVVSWVVAIVTLLGMNLLIAFATGRLSGNV